MEDLDEKSEQGSNAGGDSIIIIRTIDELVDYVHRLAHERAEWDRAKLLNRIHYALVMTLKRTQMSTPDTHHAYFQLCAHLTTPNITRSRLLATVDGIGTWLNNR